MNEINAAIYAPNIPTVNGDFELLAVRVGRTLTAAEVEQVSGCIGYALRIHVAGEDLSEPKAVIRCGGETLITYFYDTTKAQRSSPDAETALRVAAQFIFEGTPIRSSNRAGPNTRGTRAVQSIGPVELTFYVDQELDPEPTPPAAAALGALNAARDALNVAQYAYAQAAIQYAKVSA